MKQRRMRDYLPALSWLQGYSVDYLKADMIAGIVVTMMLIPQSLAYALLAGMPAEVGLYASILPLVAYALFGSSRTLSVGPVAVVSLMTMVSLGNLVEQGTADYLSAAIALAFLSGLFLLIMGLFKLGFVANFISHTVVSGFITALGIIIALSQVPHLLGISAEGDTLPKIIISLIDSTESVKPHTLLLGLLVLAFLFWAKTGVVPLLKRLGVSAKNAHLMTKAAPVMAVIATIAAGWLWNLEQYGVAIVGHIPKGLPALVWPNLSYELFQQLWIPALSIAVIGYVESVSVGKNLAAKRRESIDPTQELIGLGAANIASAFSGGFPVTGGISRTVVNFDAGAVTQAASIFAAIGIALACVYLTPVLYFLPKVTLAATIIVAVVAVVDFSILKKTWQFSVNDFRAVAVTLIGTLFFGVQVGVICGVAVSILLYLYRTSMPHVAEVGLVDGTQHFRNIKRYLVTTEPSVISLRVDESLFFANASLLENLIYERVYQNDQIAHVVLMCSAVNEVDYSALEMLERVNERLAEQGITLHLSEIKGPVMDTLRYSGFFQHLSGSIYLTQFDAFQALKTKN